MLSRTFCPLKSICSFNHGLYSSFPANSKLAAQYALPYYHLTLKVVKKLLNRNCFLNSSIFLLECHTILQALFGIQMLL